MATPPTTIGGLADAIGVHFVELIALSESPPYDRWRVPKRSGGWRQIEAPSKNLRTAQRWIQRNIIPRLEVHDAAHGCVRGRSSVTFAAAHTGAAALLRMDVRSFFPSVRFQAVRRTLAAVLEPEVCRMAAALCTSGCPRALPQGAATSPGLANAACLALDRDMEALARARGARFTRYVDDLAFSFREPADAGRLAKEVAELLWCHGFEAHKGKTRIMRAHQRQELVGLVVNGDGPPRPSRGSMRRLRAAIHQAGDASPQELHRIQGMISYVSMSNQTNGRRLRQQLEQSLAGKTTAQ